MQHQLATFAKTEVPKSHVYKMQCFTLIGDIHKFVSVSLMLAQYMCKSRMISSKRYGWRHSSRCDIM